MTVHTLSQDLRSVLARVEVLAGAREAVVDGKRHEARTPTELKGLLAAEMYTAVHAGHPTDAAQDTRPRTLRDPEFEQRLAAALPRRTAPVPALLWSQETALTPEDEVVVDLPDGRVRVPAELVSGARCHTRGERVLVDLPAGRPAVSPGFLAVSSPTEPDGDPGTAREQQGPVRRVYVHVGVSDRAAPIWKALIEHLEERHVRYSTKALSSAGAYPRRDALVFYLRTQDPSVWQGLARVATGLEGLGEDVSPLTERLAPGVSTAMEPADDRPGREGLSFGQHRCNILAEVLVGHRLSRRGPATAPDLEAAVIDAFIDARIDPSAPYDNLTDTNARTP